jgi:CheY-like chemotaxis protein
MIQEVAARAFEPFYTTKPVGRGSGLGLSQVYGVARQLGGGARIESRWGTGTAVFVFLPATNGKAEGPSRLTLAAPVNVTQAHVLVVDDDPAVRETTAALLGELGYDVYEAASGEEALEALACEPPIDVMLTDVVMPVMTGPELARRARASYPGLPVVFISGYSDPEALVGAGEFANLVRKPARPDVLVQAIEGALTRHPAAAE